MKKLTTSLLAVILALLCIVQLPVQVAAASSAKKGL